MNEKQENLFEFHIHLYLLKKINFIFQYYLNFCKYPNLFTIKKMKIPIINSIALYKLFKLLAGIFKLKIYEKLLLVYNLDII